MGSFMLPRDCPSIWRRIVAQPPALRTPSASRRMRAIPNPLGGARLGAYGIIDHQDGEIDSYEISINQNNPFYITLK
ncbi:MAG: hypothetical protein KJ714_10040 [Euryarchaeota archaeon]|nr:hypothetical protein [Euryarchaeota archaeon]